MKYSDLGKTGLSLSVVAFGCGPTGGGVLAGTPLEQELLVGHAIDAGINIFDTAAIYGQGKSEENLGRALNQLKASPIIASKVALELPDLNNIKQSVISSVEASLKRLQADSIDLIQLHNRIGLERSEKGNIGVGAQLTAEDVLGPNGVIEAFKALREQGKIKFTGFTGFGGIASEVFQLTDSNKFDTINVLFNLLNRSAITTPPAPHSADDTENNDFHGVGSRAFNNGMGVLAIRVLAAGNLINFTETKGNQLTKFKKLKLRERVKRMGPDMDTDLAILSTRFALSCPEITSLVIGFSNTAQIKTAMQSIDGGKLEEQEYNGILISDI